MKSVFRHRRPVLFLAAFASVAFSSCNRGYGCPTNFSIGETVESLVTTLVSLV